MQLLQLQLSTRINQKIISKLLEEGVFGSCK